MSGGFIVKDRLSIVYGPCPEQEAVDFARGLNADYQTDAYRVEEWSPSAIHLIPDLIDAHGDDFAATADDRRDRELVERLVRPEWTPDPKDIA